MVIYRATLADTEAIWQIFQKIIAGRDKFPFPPDTPKEFCDEYFLSTDTLSFVAKENDRILGCYKIIPNQCGLCSHVANATYMVDPDIQGKGIGKAMVKHSFEEASKAGYEAMQFNLVVSTNEAPIHLYQKLGFKIIGTIPKAFEHLQLKRKVDVHIMHRFLGDIN
ncbi:MAG: GNAT family N-acetyltransferase [Pseudomonadota bacterium]